MYICVCFIRNYYIGLLANNATLSLGWTVIQVDCPSSVLSFKGTVIQGDCPSAGLSFRWTVLRVDYHSGCCHSGGLSFGWTVLLVYCPSGQLIVNVQPYPVEMIMKKMVNKRQGYEESVMFLS